MSLQRAAPTALLLSLLTMPPLLAAAETLADGNVRDPAPDEAALAGLAVQAKKNMVFLPGGTFEMGDWGSTVAPERLPFDHEPDSKPLHKVRLSAYSMSKYPVTYAEFDLFTAAMRLPRINQLSTMASYRKPSNPAGVSWQGAKDYCQWLGKLSGLPLDLPSEAQWEYAARSGGKRHLFATDNGKAEPGRNLPTLAQADAAGGLAAVDSYPANPAGFHYFAYGISEWTGDWYDERYYARSPAADPRGPEQGERRVVRGYFGSDAMTIKRWSRAPAEKQGTWTRPGARAGAADTDVPHTRYSGLPSHGFRCVADSGARLVN